MGKSRKSSHERDDLQDTQTAALIWLGFAFVVGALLFIAYYMQKMKSKKKTSNQIGVGTIGGNVGEPTGAVQAEMAGGRRRPRTARQRMVRRRQYDDEEDEFFDEDFDDDEEGGAQIPWSDDQSAGKVGTKKLRKIQEKAEKKVQREEELQEREDRKKREQLKEEERKREVERQKCIQEQEDEEERLKKEEQEQKEHEEYLMLKESFTVEESGETGVISEEESQTLLQEFIDYIVETKVVMLEDLAAQFGLRVQDTIKRLEDLQEAGRLTGVMDDRGKFISISEEELNNVARFIKQRGRVAISDLAESSNTLISMKGNSSTLKNGKQIRTVEASA